MYCMPELKKIKNKYRIAPPDKRGGGFLPNKISKVCHCNVLFLYCSDKAERVFEFICKCEWIF